MTGFDLGSPCIFAGTRSSLLAEDATTGWTSLPRLTDIFH